MIPEQTREHLRMVLIRDEGVVLHAYPDHLGYLTIGVGRLIDKRKGGGITYSEALFLLDNDMDRFAADVIERFPQFLTLDPVRQVVLLSMAFQMGVNGLAEFHGTLAAVWRKDYVGAATGMISSKWALQTPARVHRLAQMMRHGTWAGTAPETKFA